MLKDLIEKKNWGLMFPALRNNRGNTDYYELANKHSTLHLNLRDGEFFIRKWQHVTLTAHLANTTLGAAAVQQFVAKCTGNRSFEVHATVCQEI